MDFLFINWGIVRLWWLSCDTLIVVEYGLCNAELNLELGIEDFILDECSVSRRANKVSFEYLFVLLACKYKLFKFPNIFIFYYKICY